MALRVSLQIDGNADGAEQAAQSASDALKGLGKDAGDAAKGLEDVFNKAAGAAGKMNGAAQAAGAANDNAAGSVANYAKSVGDLSTKALGAENALTKAANGAAGFLSKFSDVAKAGSSFTFLTGAIGLAITAATTFYDLLRSRSATTATDLSRHEELINRVTTSYGEAAKKAAEFYSYSKAGTILGLMKDQRDLDKSLRSEVGSALSKMTTYGGLGDVFSGVRQVRQDLLPVEDAVFKLFDSFKAGKIDVKGAVDELGKIADQSPKYRDAAITAADILSKSQDLEFQSKKTASALDIAKGVGTEAEKAFHGLAKTTGDSANEFDRMAKALGRQAIVQEAEAASVGKSAGESAKLRAQMLLVEAAQRSGLDPAGKYALAIDAIATRFGNAAQKAAEMQLKSGAAFDLSQLGRTTSEQSIASALRGAYGDNVNQYMNGAIANTLRFTAALSELKSTTLDLASGAWHTFLSGVQNGQSVFKALGDAGVNALGRIAEKLGDKALDGFISALFGGSGTGFLGKLFGTGGSSYGPITLGGAAGPTPFFAAAGGSFGPGWGVVGEKGAEIIKVGLGGVTVFPHEVSKPYLPGFASGGTLSALGQVSRFGSPSPTAATRQIVVGDTNLHIYGNVTPDVMPQIQKELAAHRKAIQEITDQATSQSRYSENGNW